MRIARETGVALVTALLILLLVSSIAVGFAWLVMTDQALGGNSGDRQAAFYGGEAGMEKLTADLGSLFDSNYAPSGTDITALTQSNFQPQIPGVTYISPDGSSGYQVTFPKDNKGNPVATNQTIHSGPYQGLIALLTPYTLTVTSHTINNSEVRLQRTVQTVSIPVFQFGIFSQTDLSFFAGPNFNFGGRVHTNGNLWLAEGGGNTVTLSDRVTAVKDVIRTNLSNGWFTSSNYTGTVTIAKAPNTYANLGMNQGSLVGTLGSAWNEPTWTSASLGTFNGYIRSGRTGAKPLNLTIALNTNAFPIDLVRRGLPNEDQLPPTGNPGVLGQRYYSQASLKILLSDNPTDITSLPCIDTTTAPLNLAAPLLPAQLGGVPLAVSGGPVAGNPYKPSLKGGDGYWYPLNTPLITGFIKIEVQTSYPVPPAACGTWKDVTAEILGLGIAARNLNPLSAVTYKLPPANLTPLPAVQLGPSGCPDPSPNAVIRLERVRDNPSTANPNGGCGGTVGFLPTDLWPLALFDTREGNPRDTVPGGSITFGGSTVNYSAMPTLGGVMYYVELDVKNLSRWFTGAIGVSGQSAKDATDSTNDFVVYFSDRRGNYTPAAVANTWPPASPSGHETGEYGFEDFANPSNQFGCPDSVLNIGEGLDVVENPGTQQAGQTLLTYGESNLTSIAGYPSLSNIYGTLLKGVDDGTGPAQAVTPNPKCGAPASIWPGWYVVSAQEARENLPFFFRRALKIKNGASISLGVCPNGVNCGLTIVSENPVYLQGDYNACPNGSFCDPHVASAIIGDAVTFLSNNWNDVNSFAFPYNTGGRIASTTTYRTAAVSGKGISFPQPTGYATYQDFGTDGGVHNFLRYVENWGGQTLFYRGSIVSFYYNRQAVGVYKCCTTVYSPPTRGYNFEVEFLQPTLLPPRTPMFRDVNTIGFTQLIMPNQ